jgi:hypothetical protein
VGRYSTLPNGHFRAFLKQVPKDDRKVAAIYKKTFSQELGDGLADMER